MSATHLSAESEIVCRDYGFISTGITVLFKVHLCVYVYVYMVLYVLIEIILIGPPRMTPNSNCQRQTMENPYKAQRLHTSLHYMSSGNGHALLHVGPLIMPSTYCSSSLSINYLFSKEF